MNITFTTLTRLGYRPVFVIDGVAFSQGEGFDASELEKELGFSTPKNMFEVESAIDDLLARYDHAPEEESKELTSHDRVVRVCKHCNRVFVFDMGKDEKHTIKVPTSILTCT